jgi:hypothetical protein
MAVTTVVVQVSGTEVVVVDVVQSAQVPAEVVLVTATGVVVVVVEVVVEVVVQSAQVLDEEATPAEAVEMMAATAATEAATFILMVGFGRF